MKNIYLTNTASLLIKNDTVRQAAKYFVVGGFCTLLDFSLLYGLTHYLNMHYVLSSIISFMSGTILNYFLCTFWIFKIRIVENQNLEFFYYAVITAFGLGINTFLIWAITEYLSFNFMYSKVLATFVTFWWNFGARKYFLHTIR
jgi:putative flippase GtrA